VLADFKSALQDDVLDFTSEDKDFLVPIVKELGKIVGKFSSDFLNTDIKFIKISGRHYGPSVYYTRENCIIIPRYELMKRNEKLMKSILAHELFHIYSRYHPEKRQALYAMIGFQPLKIQADQLILPEALSSSLLLNPDGIDYLNFIELETTSGEKRDCIMLTSSNFHQFSSAHNGFFPYLTANFYPIEKQADGTYTVKTILDGTSPLKFRDIAGSLFAQIGDNTDYFIHPDEILADNFAILAAASPEEIQKVRGNDRLDLLGEMKSIIEGEN
jgi:hypothetical protein